MFNARSMYGRSTLSHHGVKGMKRGNRRIDTDGDGRIDVVATHSAGAGGAIVLEGDEEDVSKVAWEIDQATWTGVRKVLSAEVKDVSADVVRKGAALVDKVDGKGNLLSNIVNKLDKFAHKLNAEVSKHRQNADAIRDETITKHGVGPGRNDPLSKNRRAGTTATAGFNR